jgi:hypothetical protein
LVLPCQSSPIGINDPLPELKIIFQQRFLYSSITGIPKVKIVSLLRSINAPIALVLLPQWKDPAS